MNALSLNSQIFFVDPHFMPRYYQLPVFEARAKGVKRFVLVWHRRSGKDKTCWELMQSEAFKTPGNYWYMFPEYEQGRKAFWESIDSQGNRILDYIPDSLLYKEIMGKGKSEQEMKIHLKTHDNITGKNKNSYSSIQVVGADKPDSLRGSNPKGVICSEYAEFKKPSIFSATIEPAILENDGWCVFNFTSKGRNAAYKLYKAAQKDPNWYTSNLTINDTMKLNSNNEWQPVISQHDVENIRKRGDVPEVIIQREYYNNFDAIDDHAYYQTQMNHLLENNKITNIHYNPRLPLFTAWDLGFRDHLAIWFIQFDKQTNQLRAIDFFQDTGISTIAACDYLHKLALEKGYKYEAHIAPHDIMKHDQGSGLTQVEIARQAGIKFTDEANQVTKAAKISINDGIELTRKLLPYFQFDRINCEEGLESLRNYRKEFNEKLDTIHSKPLHDKYSHGADAFRYFCVWWDRHNKQYQLKLNYDEEEFNPPSSIDYLDASGY